MTFGTDRLSFGAYWRTLTAANPRCRVQPRRRNTEHVIDHIAAKIAAQEG